MYNLIADIAGQFDALQALLAKMPKGSPISIGDMVDRGPKSKEVLEFFMKNGQAVMGNHEHMMLDHLRGTNLYEPGIWQYNGGYATMDSFGHHVPERYLTWLESLSTYIEYKQEPDGKRVLISHAFVHSMFKTVDEAALATESSPYSIEGDKSIFWNRGYPIPRSEYDLQICGHNSQYGLRWISDESKPESEPFALCLDDSKHKKLTGIHLPTLEIFQVDF